MTQYEKEQAHKKFIDTLIQRQTFKRFINYLERKEKSK